MRRIPVILVGILLLAGLVTAAGVWYARRDGAAADAFRTTTVKRGDLVSTISATGTVEPEEVVDVGAQVAGQIIAFGQDTAGKSIDYGSPVEEGTVLARIDDSLYASDVASAQAQLEQAKAGVVRAQADLLQMKAKLDQAQRDWDRAQKLGPSEALAQSAFDAYRAAFETARANVAVGEATIQQQQTLITQAQATLLRAQRNLAYCTIKSPVKGVIIDRRVNTGQTVVSSLNAPSLFLIAKDLRRMQVWVAVNEADIGSIHAGQPVAFTVDAFPGQAFTGQVGKVRLNASMTQNVVTYTVEVVTDNSSGRLLPYLTANAQFETGRRQGVLMVQNAAVRWTPRTEQVAPEAREAAAGKAPGAEKAAPKSGAERTRAPEAAAARGKLWVRQNGFVRPIPVRTGLSDGLNTEVAGEGVTEGMEVVIGDAVNGAAKAAPASGGGSPFTPQIRRSRPSGGGGGGPGGGGPP